MSELLRQDSPYENPLLESQTLKTRRRLVKVGTSRELVDLETGEVQAVTLLHSVEHVDPEHFVKIFANGVKAMFGLTRTGQRVFNAILLEYQQADMNGAGHAYADAIYLHWFGDGLSGRDIGMSERTFQRGLRELLLHRFLAPRSGNLFWVNPALFFKGSRVAFLKEYRRQLGEREAVFDTPARAIVQQPELPKLPPPTPERKAAKKKAAARKKTAIRKKAAAKKVATRKKPGIGRAVPRKVPAKRRR